MLSEIKADVFLSSSPCRSFDLSQSTEQSDTRSDLAMYLCEFSHVETRDSNTNRKTTPLNSREVGDTNLASHHICCTSRLRLWLSIYIIWLLYVQDYFSNITQKYCSIMLGEDCQPMTGCPTAKPVARRIFSMGMSIHVPVIIWDLARTI